MNKEEIEVALLSQSLFYLHLLCTRNPSKQNDLDDNLERSVFCYYFSIFILVFNDKISLKPLIILANYVILGMLHYTHYNGLIVFFLIKKCTLNK